MAENLIAPRNSVLHTRSDVALKSIGYNFISTLNEGEKEVQSKVLRLEKKEQELYRRFGANDYKEFISQVRTLYNSGDRVVLERFEANHLSKVLQSFADKKGALLNKEVRFTINTEKIKTAKIKIPKSKEVISFSCIYNTEALKKAFNEAFGINKFRGSDSGTLDKLVRDLLEDQALIIEVAKGKGENKKYQ